MRIEAVDFFYLAMPEVTDEADGSQDALLVRVAAGGQVGLGRMRGLAARRRSPPSSAPMSHGVCRPVVGLGARQALDRAGGHRRAWRRRSPTTAMDLLQAPHTLLRHRDGAVGSCSGRRAASRSGACSAISRSHRRCPTPRVLFGDTPQETLERAQRDARAKDFSPESSAGVRSGAASAQDDADHFAAAREGLGPDGIAARRCRADLHRRRRARGRAPARARSGTARLWLEEPFAASALKPMARSRGACKHGEARGRRGRAQRAHGAAPDRLRRASASSRSIAAASAASARRSRSPTTRSAKGVTFVNHTFTSHLALSASLQPLRGPRGSPHLRVSRRAEAARARHSPRTTSNAGSQRRDRRARCAGARHHGLRRRRTEISAGRRHPREWAAAVCDGGTVGGARRDWIGIAGSDYRRIWPATLCEARMR